MRTIFRFLSAIVLAATLSAGVAQAQTSPQVGATSSPTDSAVVFESPRPLVESQDAAATRSSNQWGLSAFFSDYGFGFGGFYAKEFSPDFTGVLSLDLGSAKGSREFGFEETKVNRIFVSPLIASVQYRVLRNQLSDNFRPYLTAGAGPVFVTTTPANEEFFTAFGSAQTKIVPGGFLGLGANFGSSKESVFGANIRYYIIPYPAPGVQSTSNGAPITNFNALFLGITYGMYF